MMDLIRSHIEIIEEIAVRRRRGSACVLMSYCRVYINGVDIGIVAQDSLRISTDPDDVCRVALVLLPDSVTIRKG